MVVATKPYIETQPAPVWRWCPWCGHPTKYGRHFANGDFDYDSVDVPESEVVRYVKKARKNGNLTRPAELIRRNISLGYHAGARG